MLRDLEIWFENSVRLEGDALLFIWIWFDCCFFYGLMMNGSFDWLNSLSDLEVLLLGKRRGPDIEKCWVVYYR